MEAAVVNIVNNIMLQPNELLFLNDEDDLPYLYVVIDNEPNDGIRIKNYVEEVIPNYSISTFKSHFRMTPTAFEAVLHALANCPELQKRPTIYGGRQQLSVEKTVLIAVWTLATPECYRSVADRFDVVKATVFHCIRKVVAALLNNICSSVIKWPRRQTMAFTANGFNTYGLQNCIGAIDGCHIPIKAPAESPQDYYNRKKFYSVVLQGVCDSDMFFTDCDVRWPGSVHDARVLRTSDMFNDAHNMFPPNKYIIGDAAYPCLSWLLPPFKNNGQLTEQQIFFNTSLSKTRVVIERAFALLKGRFRRLKYLEMASIANINKTIIACCVLHNICLQHDEDVEEYIQENLHDHIPGLPAADGDVEMNGVFLRQHMVDIVWRANH